MQPNKKILLGDAARAEIKKGIDTVVDAVKITLGPVGRNVMLSRPFRTPVITNDGVSIAQSIKLKDQYQQMGVSIAQEVASKTDSIAGDGTTTTLILLQAIINEGLLSIDDKTNVMKVRKGIELAVNAYVDELKKKAIKVDTLEKIKEVAFISVENEEIASLIANTLFEIGEKGIVTVEESDKNGVRVEMVKGMKIDKGFASPYIINNYEKLQGEYMDVPVLITDKKIMSSTDIIPLLEALNNNGIKKLLLIADDIDGEALASFTLNKARNLFDIIPVRFPVFGEGKYDELEDIAIRCGTFVVGERSEKQLKNLSIEDLGFIDKCVIKKENTLLINGKGDITDRVVLLEALKSNTDDKDIIKNTDRRIGNLLSNVAVIKVGADTDTERRYLKLKVDDAVNATRGAMEEGIVAGGGWALAGLDIMIANQDKDIKKGINIINKASTVPMKQLLDNCGMNTETLMYSQGYNAKTERFTDYLIDEGVVDPVKVTINALRNASSIAAMFLTTEVIVADEEEYKPNHE